VTLSPCHPVTLSSSFLPLITAAEVHLLEAKAAAELDARFIGLDDLQFGQLEILFLQVTEDIAQEILGQALPAQVRAYFEVKDARGCLVPAPAKAFHLPDQGAGAHLAGRLFEQAECERLDRAEDALLPPGANGFAGAGLQVEAESVGGKARVHDLER